MDRTGQVWVLEEHDNEVSDEPRFVSLCLIVDKDTSNKLVGVALDDADGFDVGSLGLLDDEVAFNEPPSSYKGSRYVWRRVL